MNAKNIMDALNGIDETLFDVSEEHVKKGGTVLSKWMAAVAALAMAGFTWLAEKKHWDWLDNFSIAGSMLLGMLAAVLAGQ